MTKKELRKIFGEKRNQLTETQILKFDDLLLIQFQKLFLPDIQYVFTYIPFALRHEPDTSLTIKYLQYLFPHIKIANPRTDFATGEMEAVLIQDHTVFELNKYGLAEPEKGLIIEPEKIDLIIVPLLTFDLSGFRVGYGKGFYDRFLIRCKKEVMTVGLSYFEPIEKIEDTNTFDVSLKYCITPERVYEF
ncbi:MAG: 5-formyltetrahydrofolate cyclo-ligase [Bacteroidetes bacterium]|nr:5-formyltetrahydrofolate cyclo-ligase [Bacteroidota bacterium]